jgi:ABC-type transporter Mla subunit MlaD
VISETFSAVNQHIGRRTGEATQAIEATTRQLSEMLSARSTEISRILDETARPLIERFADSGNELQQRIESTTQQALERLSQESNVLVDVLGDRTSHTLSELEQARHALARSVREMNEQLSGSAAQIGEVVQSTTAEATRRISSQNAALAQSVKELTAQLEQSSTSLSDIVDGAVMNLATLDQNLARSAQNFSETAEKATGSFEASSRLIDNNTSKLANLSSKTLTDIGAIAHSFSEHGKMLQNASDLLGSAQNNLTSTLEERKMAIEGLSEGLLKKSEEIERAMRSFEDIIEKTLEKAEGRTLGTTEKLRTAIGEVVDMAGKKFSDATDEIRRTAATIRSELEQTRSELKQGVSALPEETRESTSAMRKAVSEQISALKELADIVAKSGRAFDISAAPSQPAAPPRNPAPAAAPPAARSATLERPAPTYSHPAQPEAAPAAGAQTQGRGWVRDLLRGASREDEATSAPKAGPTVGERSRLHLVESLNSLSVDIARAIDHDASIELWERYRRGERNVFTRRLYTLKGQQTFDEIRRKYQADGEFRAAVDRYCQDFEKLLNDVTKNDRDNMMAQTYLSSDTGKVYTMLAHASGRLQ